MLIAFLRGRSGNFATMMAVVAVPLLMSVAVAADYANVVRTKAKLQRIADVTSLNLASSRVKQQKELEALAAKFAEGNRKPGDFDAFKVTKVTSNKDEVTIELDATITPNFGNLLNMKTIDLGVKSTATRSMVGAVEVALVLDNTYSMIEADGKGVTKIQALKDASNTLVEQLFSNTGADVRVGVVPYADYVNVGTGNRSASWLSIPDDKVVTYTEQCVTTQTICNKPIPTYPCTSIVDGVAVAATCGGGCEAGGSQIKTLDKPICSTRSPSTYKWYGCIGSRMISAVRLSDGSPLVPYPGFINTYLTCPAPILAMSDSKSAVLAKVKEMSPNTGYKPSTYIPAGLTWGLNLLSPGAPYTDGKAYDLTNRKPRKVLVLMTDGDNTMRYQNNAPNKLDSLDGTHVKISTNADGTYSAAAKLQVQATNADTTTLCDELKSADRQVEIFTVALMVDNDDARTMLQNCASNTKGTLDHYYPAEDAAALAAAFTNIGQKLSVVRLVD